MRLRASIVSLLSLVSVACAAGSARAPMLAYELPSSAEVTYVVGDTLSIAVQGLGQGMEISARSTATYLLRYDRGAGAVRVTATVETLTADVVMPMAGPISMDEGALEGDFVFELDARGRATSMSSPQANQLGGQVFAAPVVAHALFPRLSGRQVATGDNWVDEVTYREEGEAGVTEVRSTLTYTVVGEAQVNGRALVEMTFGGTATVTQDLTLEGARINQASELEIDGRLRWDASARLLYESEMSMEGPGSVSVALLPGATLPTSVRWRTRVSLQPR
jgi:hypothetical protein